MPQSPTSITHVARYARIAEQPSRPTPVVRGSSPVSSEPDTFWRHGKSDKRQTSSAAPDRLSLSPEAQMIRELQLRDRQVRAHETAHAAAGGVHAGHPTYTLQQGPDGHSYAIGGEVSISTSEVPYDPQASLDKAETVRRAALAPADPSPADHAIAAKALQMARKARQELTSGDSDNELFGATAVTGPDSDPTPPAGTLLNLRA